MVNIAKLQKKYLTPKNLMIGGGLALGAYLLYTNFIAGPGGASAGPVGAEGLGQDMGDPNVQAFYEVRPSQVKPNSVLTITGSFINKDGTQEEVPNSYYYIYEDAGILGPELKTMGFLGANLTNFEARVPTTNYRGGQYRVVITDYIIDDKRLGYNNAGPGGGGAQTRPAYPWDPTSLVERPNNVSMIN